MYRDIPAPAVWFDAESIAGISNGAPVTSWLDRTGRFTATPAGTTVPTYTAAMIGGKPAVRLYGGDSRFNTDAPSAKNKQTVFMVMSPWSSPSGTSKIVGTTANGGVDVGLTDVQLHVAKRGIQTAQPAPPGVTMSFGTYLNIRTISVDNLAVSYYNSGQFASGDFFTTAPDATSNVYIGSNLNSLNGHVAEIIIYDRVLSNAERAVVHSYLSDKYQIGVGDYAPDNTPQPEPGGNVLPVRTGRKYSKVVEQLRDPNKLVWADLISRMGRVYSKDVGHMPNWSMITGWPYETYARYDLEDTGGFSQFSLTGARLSTSKGLASGNIVPDTDPINFYQSQYTEDFASIVLGATVPLPILSGNELRKSEFSVIFDVMRVRDTMSGVVTTPINTLKFSTFDIKSVPRDAIYTGVEVFALNGQYSYPIGGGIIKYEAVLAGVGIDVRYFYDGKLGGTDVEQGYVSITNKPETPVSQKKSYQYNVSRGGTFLGEYDPETITNDPVIKNSVNQLPGELNIDIARDLSSSVNEFEGILINGYPDGDEDEDLLLTHTQEVLFATIEVKGAIGKNTDIEANNYIDLKEYYGGFEGLVTTEGEPLITTDLEPLSVENGYPMGRSMFKGFISKYRYGYDANGALTRIKVLNHADEHNHIVLEKEDTVRISNLVPADPMGGYLVYNNRFLRDTVAVIAVAQTFTPTASYDVSGMSFFLSRNGFSEADPSTYPNVSAILRQGAPNGTGAIISSTLQRVRNHEGLVEYRFSFEEAKVVAGTMYSVTLQPSTGFIDNPQGDGYVGFLVSSDNYNSYTGGSAYVRTAAPFTGLGGTPGKPAAPTWSVASGIDLHFQLWERGGETSVSMNSQDPSQMLRNTTDFASRRGSQITYTDTSILNTGTVVSGRFNTNKIVDANEAILKYAPSDWYQFYHPADLTINMLPRPEIVKHWFTLGKDIEVIYIDEDIEDLVNEVYFSGGELENGKNLMKRFVNTLSQSEIRRGLAIISDNRVTDEATADIIANSEINRKSDMVVIGELTILRKFYEEVVDPGDLTGYRGFDNHIDFLRLQAVQVETTPDRIIMKLGVLLPPVSKRVEDIRRNLQVLEMQNNPVSPT